MMINQKFFSFILGCAIAIMGSSTQARYGDRGESKQHQKSKKHNKYGNFRKKQKMVFKMKGPKVKKSHGPGRFDKNETFSGHQRRVGAAFMKKHGRPPHFMDKFRGKHDKLPRTENMKDHPFNKNPNPKQPDGQMMLPLTDMGRTPPMPKMESPQVATTPSIAPAAQDMKP